MWICHLIYLTHSTTLYSPPRHEMHCTALQHLLIDRPHKTMNHKTPLQTHICLSALCPPSLGDNMATWRLINSRPVQPQQTLYKRAASSYLLHFDSPYFYKSLGHGTLSLATVTIPRWPSPSTDCPLNRRQPPPTWLDTGSLPSPRARPHPPTPANPVESSWLPATATSPEWRCWSSLVARRTGPSTGRRKGEI